MYSSTARGVPARATPPRVAGLARVGEISPGVFIRIRPGSYLSCESATRWHARGPGAALALGMEAIVACKTCGLVQRLSELAPGMAARCDRCGSILGRRTVD